MQVTATILIVGTDPILLETRAAVLRGRYEATTVHPDEAVAVLRTLLYDILVVCSSLPFEKASKFIKDIRQEFPTLPIVRLVAIESPEVETTMVEKIVRAAHEPGVWLKAVDELVAARTGHG